MPIFAEYNSKTIYMNKREYAKANLEWLAEKAKEDGVKSLPRGIYYKVLSEGNADGKHPLKPWWSTIGCAPVRPH